jgi:hypothetical protein
VEPTVFLRRQNKIEYLRRLDRYSVDGNVRFYFNDNSKSPFWIGAGMGTNRIISWELGFHRLTENKDTKHKGWRFNLSGFWDASALQNQPFGMEISVYRINLTKGGAKKGIAKEVRRGIRDIFNGKPGKATLI